MSSAPVSVRFDVQGSERVTAETRKISKELDALRTSTGGLRSSVQQMEAGFRTDALGGFSTAVTNADQKATGLRTRLTAFGGVLAQNATSFGVATASVWGAFNAYDSLEKVQIRAHAAATRVATLETTVATLTQRRDAAVRKGNLSAEQMAILDDRIANAQSKLSVAQERNADLQQDVNEAWAAFASQIGPQVVAAGGSIVQVVTTLRASATGTGGVINTLKGAFTSLAGVFTGTRKGVLDVSNEFANMPINLKRSETGISSFKASLIGIGAGATIAIAALIAIGTNAGGVRTQLNTIGTEIGKQMPQIKGFLDAIGAWGDKLDVTLSGLQGTWNTLSPGHLKGINDAIRQALTDPKTMLEDLRNTAANTGGVLSNTLDSVIDPADKVTAALAGINYELNLFQSGKMTRIEDFTNGAKLMQTSLEKLRDTTKSFAPEFTATIDSIITGIKGKLEDGKITDAEFKEIFGWIAKLDPLFKIVEERMTTTNTKQQDLTTTFKAANVLAKGFLADIPPNLLKTQQGMVLVNAKLKEFVEQLKTRSATKEGAWITPELIQMFEQLANIDLTKTTKQTADFGKSAAELADSMVLGSDALEDNLQATTPLEEAEARLNAQLKVLTPAELEAARAFKENAMETANLAAEQQRLATPVAKGADLFNKFIDSLHLGDEATENYRQRLIAWATNELGIQDAQKLTNKELEDRIRLLSSASEKQEFFNKTQEELKQRILAGQQSVANALELKLTDKKDIQKKLLDYIPDKLAKQLKVDIKMQLNFLNSRQQIMDTLMAAIGDPKIGENAMDKIVKGQAKYLREKFPNSPEAQKMAQALEDAAAGDNTKNKVAALIHGWEAAGIPVQITQESLNALTKAIVDAILKVSPINVPVKPVVGHGVEDKSKYSDAIQYLPENQPDKYEIKGYNSQGKPIYGYKRSTTDKNEFSWGAGEWHWWDYPVPPNKFPPGHPGPKSEDTRNTQKGTQPGELMGVSATTPTGGAGLPQLDTMNRQINQIIANITALASKWSTVMNSMGANAVSGGKQIETALLTAFTNVGKGILLLASGWSKISNSFGANATSAQSQIEVALLTAFTNVGQGAIFLAQGWSKMMQSFMKNASAAGNGIYTNLHAGMQRIADNSDDLAKHWSVVMQSFMKNSSAAGNNIFKNLHSGFQKVADNSDDLAKHWSVVMQSFINNAKSAAAGVNKELAKIKDVDVTITIHKNTVTAQGGFHTSALQEDTVIFAHKGEKVDIGPGSPDIRNAAANSMMNSGGGSPTIHIEMPVYLFPGAEMFKKFIKEIPLADTWMYGSA